MLKKSEKDIANRLDVSPSKIDRKLTEISSHTVLRYASLPKSINWDEFKATRDTKGNRTFIITDNYKRVIKNHSLLNNSFIKFIVHQHYLIKNLPFSCVPIFALIFCSSGNIWSRCIPILSSSSYST